MPRIRAHVVVSGRVHGVFFRVSTKTAALKYGVTGWVRNTSDGCVEAIFEGDLENVKAVVGFCQRGPPMAHVENVDLVWEEYRGSFVDFEIVQ